MRRKLGEKEIAVHIILEEGDDVEAIPHVFRRFMRQRMMNGIFEPPSAEEVMNQVSMYDAVVGKEKSISRIPLIQSLSHEKVPLSKQLIKALHEEHTVRSILKTDDTVREINKHVSNFPINLSKNKSVRDIRLEKQTQVAEATTKLLSRQYRQITLHMHPDRHGETFRKEFDALQVAYEILKDEKSRGEYVDTMIEVIEKLKAVVPDKSASSSSVVGTENGGTCGSQGAAATAVAPQNAAARDTKTSEPKVLTPDEILYMANTVFIISFMDKKETQDNEWKRYKEKIGRKSDLFLEASVYSQPPKALRLDLSRSQSMKKDGTTTRVIKLPPLSGNKGSLYQDICRGISVYAVPNNDDNRDLLLLKLEGSALASAFDSDGSGWATANITLPDYGTWNVYWTARLEDSSSKELTKNKDTPKSAITEICCETSTVYKSRAELPKLVAKARQANGKIRSSLNQWKNIGASSYLNLSGLQEWDRKFSYLDRQISNGANVAESLWSTLEQVGYSRDATFSRQKELNDLVLVLEEARLVKDEGITLIQRARQRQSMKGFKQFIADLARHSELNLWIRSAQKSDIQSFGGTSNRLYQLLMEGKALSTGNVEECLLVINSASNRNDLFSDKQCASLASKVSEKGLLIQRNETPTSSANKRSENEENTTHHVSDLRKEKVGHSKKGSTKTKKTEMEIKQEDLPEVLRRDDVLPLGTIVILQDLKQSPELNGVSGVYMGIGEHGRYNILLANECFALKLENFIISSSETQEDEETKVCEDVLRELSNLTDNPMYSTDVKLDNKSSWNTKATKSTSNKPEKTEVQNRGSIKQATGKSSQKGTEEIFMWLPESLFPRFIGRKGENIHAISVETKTRMFVDKSIKNNEGHVALRVEGTTEAIRKATEKVQAFLNIIGYDEEMLQPTDPDEFYKKSLVGGGENITIVESEGILDGSSKSTDAASEKKNESVPSSTSATICSDVFPIIAKPSKEIQQSSPHVVSPTNARDTTPSTVPEAIYVSSIISGEEASLASVAANATSPCGACCIIPPSPEDAYGLVPSLDRFLAFLRDQACCLKQSPEAFHRFLVNMDVTNITVFVDAMDDKHFLSKLQDDWVKGFKMESLRSAAVDSYSSSFLEETIMPGGLGSLQLNGTRTSLTGKSAPIGSKVGLQIDQGQSTEQVQPCSPFLGHGSLFSGVWN